MTGVNLPNLRARMARFARIWPQRVESGRLIIAVIAAIGLSGCTDQPAGPDLTEHPWSPDQVDAKAIPIVGGPALVGGGLKTVPLPSMRQTANRVSVNGCMVHFRRPNGKYTPIKRALGLGKQAREQVDRINYYYQVVTDTGIILYRVLCVIPETQAAKDLMLDRMSWLPAYASERTAGVTNRSGVIAGGESSKNLPASRSGPALTECPVDSFGCYSIDGITVTISGNDCEAQGGGFTFDAVTQTCECWTNECQTGTNIDPGQSGPGPQPPPPTGGPPPGISEADWDILNPEERALCETNIAKCVVALVLSKDAIAFGLSEGVNSDETNAFRHAFWQASLTSAFDVAYAVAWGTAHESSSNDPIDTQIDLHNNSEGRLIGLFYSNGVYSSLGEGVADFTSQGRLWCGVNVAC
jgi:Domain of unknown function (DUF6973)